MDFSLALILIGFGMCGFLLHHITVLSVRNEHTKNSFILTYIWLSLGTLWFTPLFLSIKFAILIGFGEYGIFLWIAVSIIGLLYMMALTAEERKTALKRKYGHVPSHK